MNQTIAALTDVSEIKVKMVRVVRVSWCNGVGVMWSGLSSSFLD